MTVASRRVVPLLALLVLIAGGHNSLATQGAAGQEGSAPRLSDSWLFQSAQLFYDVHARTPKPRTLSHSDLLKLQSDLNGLLAGVLALHRASVKETSKEFGNAFDPDVKASVVLIDLAYPGQNAPYAGSVVDPASHNLVINIDVALLRTIFESGVIEAAKKHRPPTKEELKSAKNTVIGLWDDNDNQAGCTDSDCLTSFLTFVSVIDSGNYSGRAKLYSQLAATQVDARYSGTLFFILAHELAHFLFGHHSHPCDAPKCQVFKSDELEADRFAAYLLTLRLGLTSGVAIALGFDQYSGISDYIGFPQFFERAYPRLGFDSQSLQSLCACGYPSAPERQENALEIAKTAIKRVPEIQAAAANIRLSEQIESIRHKYEAVSLPARGELIPSNLGLTQHLFPVKVGAKYGYMDNSGAVVIRPTYDGASEFSEGLALVDFKWASHFKNGAAKMEVDRGFIDEAGKALFHVNFPENAAYNSANLWSSVVGPFKEGRARVELHKAQGDFYGFIDKSGKIVIDSDYSYAEDFAEGVAVVMVSSAIDFGTAKFGFISPSGQFAIQPQFKWARSFSGDLAAVRDPAMDKWGFIDKEGVAQIAYQFDKAWDFHGCCALVQVDSRRFYVNVMGLPINSAFATSSAFSEGLAAVNVGGKTDDDAASQEYVTGGKWGYIDSSGAQIVRPSFGCARSFSEDLAAVNVSGRSAGGYCDGGKWSFIDRNGIEVIGPKFDDVVSDFQRGIAMVKSGGYTVYVDKTGKLIVPK